MYGIMAYLDQETEERVNQLRDGMREARITDYGMRPHVTLATHTEIEIAEFKKAMKKYFHGESVVPLFFPSLGMFLDSGTLYAAPTKNEILNRFHQRYHERFKSYVDPKSLYAPGQWVPHCTIASHLTHEKLVEAFDYSVKDLKPFHAKLESVALLELEFEADVCTNVKDILTVELKKE